MITLRGSISYFGGPDDTEDNGEGAWGYPTRYNQLAPYCALPERYVDQYNLQPGQLVTVEFNGRQVRCFLADKGPAPSTGRIIDVCHSVLYRLRAHTDSVVTVYIPIGEIVDKAQWC